jgi:hypothetical protein
MTYRTNMAHIHTVVLGNARGHADTARDGA